MGWFTHEAAVLDAEHEIVRTSEVAREHAAKVFDSFRLVTDRVEDLLTPLGAELAKHPGRFDVVLTGVVMLGQSGIALGREIRRRYAGLPVVLTSGYSHVLAQDGTFGFELLQKPYSMEQLSAVLLKAADWRREKRAAPA